MRHIACLVFLLLPAILPAQSALVITTTSPLPPAEIGVLYSVTFNATGGVPPYTWSLPADPAASPSWISLSTTGVLSGVPPAIVWTWGVNVTVTDSSLPTPKSATGLFLFNAVAPVTVVTSSLSGGEVHVPYSDVLTATDGLPPYSWTLASGALPAGITMASTGALSGTPTTSGVFTFAARVTDGLGGTATTAPLTITIIPAVVITTTSLATAEVGVGYTQALAATGGTPPYSWSISSGTVPAGITLSSGGVLSGTPTGSGAFPITVKVTDSFGAPIPGSATANFTLNVAAQLAIATTSLPQGEVGVTYSHTLSISGGAGPYIWSLASGSLPAGVTLSRGGVLSGTPAGSGSFPITIRATDSLNGSAAASFTMVIVPGVSVTTTALAQAEVGVAFSQSLSATGGTPPYSWSLAGGSLPGGVTLSSGGVLSGAATGSGAFPITVKVTDSINAQTPGSATANLTLNIAAPLAIAATSLPQGEAGVAYSHSLAISGGAGPYIWSLASGSLPAGVTLSSGGVLSGTPTGSGTFPITVRATDSLNGSASASFTLVIVPGVSITTTALAQAEVGMAYSQSLSASGGITPFIWSVASGSLPGGITLSSTGILSGTPTAAGAFTVGANVTDAVTGNATRTLTLIVNSHVSITTTSLPYFAQNLTYTATLTAAGGLAPYTWSVVGGALPPGLTLNASTGVISGTYVLESRVSAVLQVMDALGGVASARFQFQPHPLVISPTAFPDGTLGIAYLTGLRTSGGIPPYTWSASGLPPGLSISATGGVVSGTPTKVGIYPFTVTVNDQSGQTASLGFSVRIKAPPLVITTESPLPDVVLGSSISVTFGATGGVPPYTWAASSLPAGLQVVAGTLRGTVTARGTFSFTIAVTDSEGTQTQKGVSLTVKVPSLAITTEKLPGGVAGNPYSASVSATGGVVPYTWTGSGLPPGLAFSNGSISGTPTKAGSYTFTATVTDADAPRAATNSKSFTIAISPVLLRITTSGLPDGRVGARYSVALTATGGTAPIAWSASGSLPPGVTVGSDGAITGTPTAAGEFSFTVRAQDSDGATDTAERSITVSPAPVLVTTTSLPSGTAGAPYSASLAAVGGTPPYRWSASGLPTGVTLNASSGALSGMPAAAFDANVTFGVTDSASAQTSASLRITIGLPTVPPLAFGGISDTSAPLNQPRITLTLGGTFPLDISGQLTLTFQPDSGPDEPAVQFSSGGRTVAFTVPANTTTAVFTTANMALQTGTVAGLITLAARLQASGIDVTPSPAPTRTVRIPVGPPVINTVAVIRNAAGFSVQVLGYSASRDLTQAVFRFTPATGANLQTTDVTVPVSGIFTAWFASSAAASFGSQFSYTQPFDVQGSAASIASVTVTLVNSLGNSTAVTAQMP